VNFHFDDYNFNENEFALDNSNNDDNNNNNKNNTTTTNNNNNNNNNNNITNNNTNNNSNDNSSKNNENNNNNNNNKNNTIINSNDNNNKMKETALFCLSNNNNNKKNFIGFEDTFLKILNELFVHFLPNAVYDRFENNIYVSTTNLLITGEKGSGKTSIINEISSYFKNNINLLCNTQVINCHDFITTPSIL
jgi:hypothetical protein